MKKLKYLFLKMARREVNKEQNKSKAFCVGLNKTGTTSTELALNQLGYTLGDQTQGELLLEAWSKRNFKPIIDLAYTADAFQDVPFSLPYTYQALDQHFPNGKFILTIRDSAEQWRESMIRFHSKLWADGVRTPTEEDLKTANYIYEGYPWFARQLIYNVPPTDPYNQKSLIEHYHRHNQNVQEYFRHRPNKLIVINVSCKSDYLKMCNFLDKKAVGDNFPWLNSSS